MSVPEAILVLLAGVAAGTINAVVGSGTLITFPVLLAVGYPPVTANVSNSVGQVPGNVAGALGYRAELTGQRSRARRLGLVALVGGTVGAVGLLVLPAGLFEAVVPVFIGVALVLIVLQPWITRTLQRRGATLGEDGPPLLVGILVASVYGGYFGAAQGILYIAILTVTIPEALQRLNAVKNVLAAIVNGVAGIVFVLAADIAWLPAALIAAGSTVGGVLGARYGKRLAPRALRTIIVVVGVAAMVNLLT